MIDEHFLAQALGFVSFALGMYAFYQKDDRKLKLVMVIFSLNHALHFLLLGSIVSALSALISAFRTATAIYVSSKIVSSVFIIVGLVSGIYLSDSIWNLWPIVGMVIGTYSVFVLQGIKMRIGLLLGAICWLINNILVGSIGGTLLEASLIVVNIITIWRLFIAHRQQLEVNCIQ